MKTPRRVVHLVPRLFGDSGLVGGGERYARELAGAMARVVPTRLVTFGAEDATERDGDLEIRTIRASREVRGQYNNPFSPRLARELTWGDAIHCHQRRVVASSFAAVFGRATGRPVFVSDLGGGGWDVSAYVNTDRWYRGHLHISEYCRRLCGHEGNPRARVILGGVDAERFSPPPGDATREKTALFVGRLIPHKGVDRVVEALPPGLKLKIVGRPYDARYAADLRRLAEGRDVEFVHDADDARLVEEYRRARCVVLPSVYRTRYGDETTVPELLGQTLLEGMAAGAATIATRVASLPEVVEDGETGILVPPDDSDAMRDALARLAEDADLAARMGRAGRARAIEKFSWGAVVARCLAAYRGEPEGDDAGART